MTFFNDTNIVNTNTKRYKEFIDFITSKSDTSINYIVNNLTNKNIIHKQINNSKKCKIIYNNKKYPKKYIDTKQSDIIEFIKWSNTKNSKKEKQNILVICHNKIMINFLDKYYPYTYYKKSILETNNFSFKVTFENNSIGNPIVYFYGIKNPIGKEDDIDINCSLCVENRKCTKNKKDKKIHTNLINNKEKYFF